MNTKEQNYVQRDNNDISEFSSSRPIKKNH